MNYHVTVYMKGHKPITVNFNSLREAAAFVWGLEFIDSVANMLDWIDITGGKGYCDE